MNEVFYVLGAFTLGALYARAVWRFDPRDRLSIWAKKPSTTTYIAYQAWLGLPGAVVLGFWAHPIAGAFAGLLVVFGTWYGVGALRAMRRASPEVSCRCTSCPANGA